MVGEKNGYVQVRAAGGDDTKAEAEVAMRSILHCTALQSDNACPKYTYSGVRALHAAVESRRLSEAE